MLTSFLFYDMMCHDDFKQYPGPVTRSLTQATSRIVGERSYGEEQKKKKKKKEETMISNNPTPK